MKSRTRGLLAATAALALALSACGGSTSDTSAGGGNGGSGKLAGYSVSHIVNGYLGDQGFFDDAQRGIDALAKLGAKTNTLQADPNNPAQWKANLESEAGKNDVIVCGTSQMIDILAEAAPKYPDQKFVIYDDVVTAPNVASIVYAQNEGSFLAGVLAGLVTTDQSKFPLANDKKVVGVVGGMDIPVIHDFAVGFEAGVQAVDKDIKVLKSYVGSFADSAKGYDQAKAMISQGADVIFQVAGASGVGALQAAADGKVYGIGVDSNQNQLHPGNILASMLKNIGGSLELAITAAKAGTLKWGETTTYGLANDGVGLDFSKNNDIVPQDTIAKIDDFKKQVVAGKIKVPTAKEQ